MTRDKRIVYFVIDTETTGLPHFNTDGSLPDPYEVHRFTTSRMIEIAYLVFDYNGRELERESCRTIPKGEFSICETANKIHGLSEDEVRKTGLPASVVINSLGLKILNYRRLGMVPVFVGHNVMFDW